MADRGRTAWTGAAWVGSALAGWVVLVGSGSAGPTWGGVTAPVDTTCLADVRWLAHDLPGNYAGYDDKIGRYGGESLAAARKAAEAGAVSAGDGAACDAVVWRYLGAFHDHHLLIRSPFSKAPPTLELPAPLHGSLAPELRVLSDSTVLFRLPSFAVRYGETVAAMVEEHRADLAARPFLIIDVRQNGGGGDGTFYPLLPIVYEDTLRLPGLDYRATKDNGDRWQALLDQMPNASEALAGSIRAFADSLRRHAPGWIPGQDESLIGYDSTWSRPREVAFLADRWCASACEQLLYLARQSGKVTVYGESTRGAVDYLNLVAAPMPSGTRTLLYPISRSRRLPERPLDPTGILPDVTLDEVTLQSAEGAVDTVRLRLERSAGGRPAASRQAAAPALDSSRNNYVLPEGTSTMPLGSLGEVVHRGHGPIPMVLIPGHGFSARVYDDFMEANAERYTMYAITLAGFGHTDPPPLPPETSSYMDQTWTRAAERGVVDLIRTEGLDHPVVVGHFLTGGQLALRMAIDHPDLVRAVIVMGGEARREMGSSPDITDPRRYAVDEYLRKKWFKWVTPDTWVANNWPARYLAQDSATAAELFATGNSDLLPVLIQYLAEFFASDIPSEFDRIGVPALVLIAGFTPDFVQNPENAPAINFFQNSWQGARDHRALQVETVEGASLFLWKDEPARTYAAINEFVEQSVAGVRRDGDGRPRSDQHPGN